MTTLWQLMTEDHRRCDALYAQAEQLVTQGAWGPATDAAEGFCAAVRRHFRSEEEVLFPAFEGALGTTTGPTEVMRRDHAHALELLSALEAAARARDEDGFLGAGETLHLMIQQHNMKEEHVLYPGADQILGEAAPALVDELRVVLAS